MSTQILTEEPTNDAGPGRADQAAILAIATDTSTPIEIVRRLFVEEWAALCGQATIKQFVGIIVAQRVRRRVRQLASSMPPA